MSSMVYTVLIHSNCHCLLFFTSILVMVLLILPDNWRHTWVNVSLSQCSTNHRIGCRELPSQGLVQQISNAKLWVFIQGCKQMKGYLWSQTSDLFLYMLVTILIYVDSTLEEKKNSPCNHLLHQHFNIFSHDVLGLRHMSNTWVHFWIQLAKEQFEPTASGLYQYSKLGNFKSALFSRLLWDWGE